MAERDAESLWRLADLITTRWHLVVGAVTDSAMALVRVQQLQPDVLVIHSQLQEEVGQEVVRQVLTEGLCAVVLLVPSETDPSCIPLLDAGVHGCLTTPVRPDDLMLTMKVAAINYSRMVALAEQVARAEERLETHRLVDQAKAVLQSRYGLTEDEAYQRLRRLSMNERSPIRAVAEAVLLSQKLHQQM